MAKEAHCYIRVSTDEQAEGYSLQAQERACRLYCELHNLPVAGVYIDDGYSGTNAHRPAFARLLANVQAGDVVIVHKLDRLARSTEIVLSVLQRWQAQEIILISISEQIDFSSPIGKVMLTMLAAFGQYYSDNLSTETTKGLREKAQQGGWVGPVPFGYRRGAAGIEVEHERAAIVRQIYQWYTEGLSYNAIAAELNQRGLVSPAGRGWGRENVRVVLRTRAYCGYVRSGGIEYRGRHEHIIDESIWQAAQQLRAGRTKAPVSNRPKAQIDNIYCGKCLQPLWFTYGGRSHSAAYRCRNRPCRNRSRAELLEACYIDLIRLLDLGRDEIAAYVIDGEIVAVNCPARLQRILDALNIARWEPQKP